MSRKNKTTHDLAIFLKKISQLLESLPEKELNDLNGLSELMDIVSKENDKKQMKNDFLNVKKGSKIIDNWKLDEELQNISKGDLSSYLSNEILFPTKGALQIFATNRNIPGITKRTTKQQIIEIIKNYYERSRMFRTMNEASKQS